MTVGKKLITLREEKNLKQAVAAKAMGMNPRKLSYYETQDREMDYDTLKIVAEFYNVSVDWLLGKSEYRNEEELLEKTYYKKLKTKYGATEEDIRLAIDFIKRARKEVK